MRRRGRHILVGELDSGDASRFISIAARQDRNAVLAVSGRGVSYLDVGSERYVPASAWRPADASYVAALEEEFPGAALHSPGAFGLWLLKHHYRVSPELLFLRLHPDAAGRVGFRARAIRNALYGARCEVWNYEPAVDTSYFDINASYSYEMMQMSWLDPRTSSYRRWHDDDQAEALEVVLSREGVSEVVVSQTGTAPYLPFRQARRMFFPELRGCAGWWLHSELRQALCYGTVLEFVKKSYLFDECSGPSPLAEFAAGCWDRRPEHPIWKKIPNAVFGRLAITPHPMGGFVRYRLDPPRRACDAEVERLSAGGLIWFGTRTFITDSNPLAAAQILAGARERLYIAMAECEFAIRYVDTDAIVCDAQLPAWRIGAGIGMWKSRKLGTFRPARAKAYAADGDIRRSGTGERTLDALALLKPSAERVVAGGGTRPHAFEEVQCEQWDWNAGLPTEVIGLSRRPATSAASAAD